MYSINSHPASLDAIYLLVDRIGQPFKVRKQTTQRNIGLAKELRQSYQTYLHQSNKMHKKVTVESLYYQLMTYHHRIDPNTYPLLRNYKKYIKEKLNDSLLYEYKIDGDLVGFALYDMYTANKKKVMVITDLIIDEDMRGSGHGAKLLKKLHAIAKNKKCQQIRLMVSFKNMPAQWLYHSFGYKSSIINMIKDLT